MNKIVVYKSQSGFTKMYGELIAEKLMCDAVSMKEMKIKKLKDYDVIIFGGGVHAGSINGLKNVKKIVGKLVNKKLVVFCTGATPAEEIKSIEEIKNRNFSKSELSDIPFFYLQSGLNYNKMNVSGKMMMKLLLKMLENKADKTEQDIAMANMIKESYDISDKKYIHSLVTCVKEMDNE
jgi:menaquinone-dependent protoporphyrinogen IX oxidase